jgi:hypothetical protein
VDADYGYATFTDGTILPLPSEAGAVAALEVGAVVTSEPPRQVHAEAGEVLDWVPTLDDDVTYALVDRGGSRWDGRYVTGRLLADGRWEHYTRGWNDIDAARVNVSEAGQYFRLLAERLSLTAA